MFEKPTDGRCTATPEDLDHYMKECERINFESWARRNGASLARVTALAGAPAFDYLDSMTEAAWRAWLAGSGVSS